VIPKISQETLAEMVRTTRSRVNFFMNRFRKLGFVRYNGGLESTVSFSTSYSTTSFCRRSPRSDLLPRFSCNLVYVVQRTEQPQSQLEIFTMICTVRWKSLLPLTKPLHILWCPSRES
jgi:hypothetical protein